MTTITNTTGITIRRLGPGDDSALERLVQLDSGKRPMAPLLGAEIGGKLLVATSIATGKSIADPFSRTEELRTLVEVRIAQLRGSDGKRGRRFKRTRARSRGSLGASPPGAGGRLLTLPVRLS
ncbi:MAG: hypothetical protein M3355_06410 [Actinomycetota bacterium]|nr:hypothetical protein [Actinomycetota bacterium]